MSVFGFLRPPEEPVLIDRIAIDASTSVTTLVRRTMFAVNRLSIPAAVLTMVQQAAQVAVPIAMGLAIDRALDGGDPGSLVVWLLVLSGLYALRVVAYRAAFRLEILAMQLVCYHFRLRVAGSVLDPRRSTAVQPGAALSIFTTDVNRLGQAPGLLVYPIGDLVAIVIVTVALFVIAWPLGVAVMVGTPLMLWFLDRAARPLQESSFAQLRSAADATAAGADIVAGLRVIKGLGAERIATSRFRKVSQDALRATLRVNSSNARYEFTTDLASGGFIAAIAVLTGWLALRGRMTIGELVTAVGLTQFVAGPVQSLTRDLGTRLAEVRASARRILTVLQAPMPASADGAPTMPTEGWTLGLHQLTVGDVGQLDLTIRPGDFVAIASNREVGHGLELALARRHRPEHGDITLGGWSIDEVDDDLWRRVVLVAPHRADLFDGTILENVEPFNTTTAPTVAGSVALDAAACADLLEELPDGVSSRVGEGGVMLSGGQRQRVALARALAARSPILVLHEPTTAVDSVTEATIASRLVEVRRGLTTVLITTSPALLAVADRVVWVRDGGPAAVGRHSDLLDTANYAEMFE